MLLLKRTHLATLWGTTESGYLVSYETDAEDWDYLNIDPQKDGIEWVEVTSNRFEMRFVRDPQTAQPVFLTLHDVDTFSTGDLFSRHPTKPDHWRYEGRPDSILIIKDMLFDPSGVEKNIENHPLIKTAVVLGIHYTVVCLILELYNKPLELQPDLAGFWPTIRRSCDRLPAHQVIEPSRVILVHPDRPIPRNHKGEVKRAALAELYAAEMDSCYSLPG